MPKIKRKFSGFLEFILIIANAILVHEFKISLSFLVILIQLVELFLVIYKKITLVSDRKTT